MAEVKHKQNPTKCNFFRSFQLLRAIIEGQKKKKKGKEIMTFQSFGTNLWCSWRLSSHISQTLENLCKGRSFREVLHQGAFWKDQALTVFTTTSHADARAKLYLNLSGVLPSWEGFLWLKQSKTMQKKSYNIKTVWVFDEKSVKKNTRRCLLTSQKLSNSVSATAVDG